MATKKVSNPFVNEELLAPVKALNELAIANVEKLVEMNLAVAQKYSALALDSWKAALEVKDVEGAQGFVTRQGEVAKEVLEGMVGDAKEVVKMGQDYAAEAQKVVSANVAAVAKKAA